MLLKQMEMFPKQELSDPLADLDPTSKRKCDWCGKIRRVNDLRVVWHPYHTYLIVCEEHLEEGEQKMRYEEIGDRFIDEIFNQICMNRIKWHELDPNKTCADFALIAQEQLGQLSKAVLEGRMSAIERESIHTVAILFEIYERSRLGDLCGK